MQEMMSFSLFLQIFGPYWPSAPWRCPKLARRFPGAQQAVYRLHEEPLYRQQADRHGEFHRQQRHSTGYEQLPPQKSAQESSLL